MIAETIVERKKGRVVRVDGKLNVFVETKDGRLFKSADTWHYNQGDRVSVVTFADHTLGITDPEGVRDEEDNELFCDAEEVFLGV